MIPIADAQRLRHVPIVTVILLVSITVIFLWQERLSPFASEQLVLAAERDKLKRRRDFFREQLELAEEELEELGMPDEPAGDDAPPNSAIKAQTSPAEEEAEVPQP